MLFLLLSLLIAKSNGSFMCIDTFKEDTENAHEVLFKSNPFQTHKHSISCIQWYPIDTGMFFTSGMDKMFNVWDTNTLSIVDEYKCESKIINHSINEQSPSLTCLALQNGNVCFADLRTGSLIQTIKAHSSNSAICCKWSTSNGNNGNILATGGSDGRLILWDIRSSKSFLRIFDYLNSKSSTTSRAHSASLLGIEFVENSNYLISIGKDNSIRLWNTLNGKSKIVNYGKIILNKYNDDLCLQLSSFKLLNNSFIAIPTNRYNNLNIYNVFKGNIINELKGHFDFINCCLYHPLLNYLYTGSKDKNVLIWSKNYPLEKNEDVATSSDNNSLKRKHDSWSDDE